MQIIPIEENACNEGYPFRHNCISLGITLLSYAIGTAIFYLADPFFGLAYVILCAISLLAGVKFRCSYCYYYGKRCSSGLGLLCKLLFRRGDPNEFKNPKNLMTAGILDFGALLLPVFGGLALILLRFSILSLALLAAYTIIAVIVSFLMKKEFCKNCKQGQIGCPAYEGMKGNTRKKDQ
ncbi:hypothetical protein CUJ83_03485 [Methanocella sp. CWC-04]|uniref:DUF4395 domain-containing protein n=1 Tax=Methanooceanicella nereidis TaxID=2052831 RepID=A0AAP2W5D0_9EURY|nr:hypothetical protein [Methanocella sp. CWC-04]MCD1294057.1 hypothetical protein [Methanocella sp. CWC-04]